MAVLDQNHGIALIDRVDARSSDIPSKSGRRQLSLSVKTPT